MSNTPPIAMYGNESPYLDAPEVVPLARMSGKIVVSSSDTPQIATPSISSGKIMVPSSEALMPPKYNSGGGAYPAAFGEKRICGMKRRVFLIVAAVAAVVVIAAIVGGVVGGVNAAKSEDASSAGRWVADILLGPVAFGDGWC
jgi:hypothetical protein